MCDTKNHINGICLDFENKVLEDLQNRTKPAHVTQEEWEAYELDLEYKKVTKGFDGKKGGLTKEEYYDYTEKRDDKFRTGTLKLKDGPVNWHINCKCYAYGGVWTTNLTACDICLAYAKMYNADREEINNKLNMEKINNLVEYIYTIDANAEEPIICISGPNGGEIGGDYGVSGDQVAREILSLDAMGKKKIRVYINSVGGSVIDGQSIFDAIVRSKCSIDTYCGGIAASIAGVIFLAGKNRYITDYGHLMIHNPFYESGSAQNEFLERTRNSLVTMISTRTGINERLISDMMNRETFMDAEEALETGFATDIIRSSDYNVKRISKETNIMNKINECGLIMNSVLPGLEMADTQNIKNKKKNMLNKINSKLGLNEDASVENSLNEISKLIEIKNTFVAGEKAVNDMKAELDEMTNKHNECLNELNELKSKMDEMETSAKKEKAKDMVLNYVKLGKLKNEVSVIEKWTLMAEGNLEVVKDLLEDLPVNKTSVNIPTTGSIKNVQDYDAVSAKMAEISSKINKK